MQLRRIPHENLQNTLEVFNDDYLEYNYYSIYTEIINKYFGCFASTQISDLSPNSPLDGKCDRNIFSITQSNRGRHNCSMEDLVENVLQSAAEKESRYKTTEVHKDIDVDIDEGNLLVTDTNPLELNSLRYV